MHVHAQPRGITTAWLREKSITHSPFAKKEFSLACAYVDIFRFAYYKYFFIFLFLFLERKKKVLSTFAFRGWLFPPSLSAADNFVRETGLWVIGVSVAC